MSEQENTKEQIIVPIDKMTSDFREHLVTENKRILFSAPFGAGKSYFLHEYFQADTELLSIRLHPVDYAVASNEDIFELMKHDIIEALIEKYGEQLELRKEDFSKLLLAQQFIRNRLNVSALGKAIFNTVVPGGENITKVAEEIQQINEDFSGFVAEMNDDQEKRIIKYLAELKGKRGSIRENDAITLIIKDYVQRIKEANPGKRFAFIIDDLDRLDAEHLFRLFNVFTAHHDSRTDSNKFDFDHVIFVCDISNIRRMFRHKYGKKVDFAGYIDKFYSSHIFNFDSRKYLKDTVKKHLLSKYDFAKLDRDGLPNSLHDRYDFKHKARAKEWGNLLEFFIGVLIQHDFVRIRSFQRFQCYHLPIYEFAPLKSRKFAASDYHLLVLVWVVRQFFPRLSDLENALEFLSDNYPADYEVSDHRYDYENEYPERWLIEVCTPFLMDADLAFGNLREEKNKTFTFPNELGETMQFSYDLGWNNNISFNNIRKMVEVELDNEETEIEKGGPAKVKKPEAVIVKRPNPYWFMLCAFKNCHKHDLLNG